MMLINKVNKIMLNGLLLSLVISCNVFQVSPTTNTYQISSEQQLGKLLNFESRVKYEGLEKDKLEPKTESIKLDLDVLGSGSDKIKIPVYGEFNLIFESSNVYRISDSDASDGEARIQLPPEVLEMYINTRYNENEPNTSLKLEDKLYYLRDNLTKDNIYRLGKRLFPIPDNWHSEDKNRYILRLKNNGISKADIRFYKSDVVEYPSGIAEIGDEGGVLELRGVGKLEIPQGAMPKKTVVVMKQELQGREPLSFPQYLHGMNGNRYHIEDYVSPIVKIEPVGLKLKKDAILSLDYVDLKRLGNNHPRVLYYRFSRDQDKWYGMPRKTDIPRENWTPYLPARIDEFGYYAKFISKTTLPTDNIQAKNDDTEKLDEFRIKDIDEENNFHTLSKSNITSTFDIKGIDRITGLKYKNEKEAKKNELISRAELAYTMFSTLGYKLIKCDSDNGYLIEIVSTLINPSASAETIYDINTDDSICSKINIKSSEVLTRTALEHELWHSFQFSNLDLNYMNNSWIVEGTADYMGAKAYEVNKRKIKIPIDEKKDYISYIDKGIREIDKTIIDRGTSNKGYDTWGFFNTISRLERKDGDKSAMLAFQDIYGSPTSTTKNEGSKYLKHYHDYAVESYISTTKNYESHLGKLFVYNPTQQITTPESKIGVINPIRDLINKEKINNQSRIKNPKPINVIDIKNFSSRYYKISPELSLKGTKLKIEFNTTNNIRVTPILLTKTKNEFMYVPLHKKTDKDNSNYEYYTNTFEIADGSGDKMTFGKNTGSVVLAVSYADVSADLNSSKTVTINIGYDCPELIDDKDSNKNAGINKESTCYRKPLVEVVSPS